MSGSAGPGVGAASASAHGEATRVLALFDLDHTLIPFDSGLEWTRFLVARGVLPAESESRYLAFAHAYVAGTLDIHAMHRASFEPLLAVPRPTLLEWQAAFEDAMRSRLPAWAHALVGRHRDAGHLCAIVTATTRLVSSPFARLFGIDHLVSTEAATEGGAPDAPFTGEIDGLPAYREHKVRRVADWLREQPQAAPGGTLAAFERSWFYSDSVGDLPLLEAVSNPVAVRPDDRLRRHAVAAGWPVLDPA